MWIEPERLAQAKSVDLYSYLAAAEPGNIKRCGQDEYCLRDHDSLKVSVSTGKWNWHSRGFGGTTAVQYLVTVRGYPLPEAAQMVLNSKAAPYSPLAEPPPARPLALPQRNGNDSRVIRYLCGQRGLHREVVEHCLALDILYESAHYHHTLQQIGNIWGLSRERVRQIEAQALNKMKVDLSPTYGGNIIELEDF